MTHPDPPPTGTIASRARVAPLLLACVAAYAVAQGALMAAALPQRPGVFARVTFVVGAAALPWLAFVLPVAWLARRLRWTGWRAVASVLAHAAAATLLAATCAWWFVLADGIASPPRRGPMPFTGAFLSRLDFNLFVYLAIVGAVLAGDRRRGARDAELRVARVGGQLARARLHVLVMQLRPHFLFNTLHAISELVHRDAAAARRMLRHLRDLLRLTFERATVPEVPLGEELRMLEAYVTIQRTRFGDDLVVEHDVAPDALAAMVPMLLLQPLVENAIRHGRPPAGRPGRVVLRARRAGATVVLEVRDDGRGPGAGSTTATARREGHGLANTRLRLRELHGDDARCELLPADGGGTVARVTLPWRAGDASAAIDVPDDVAEHAAAPAPAAPRRPRVRPALLVAGAWTLWGVLWTLQWRALYELSSRAAVGTGAAGQRRAPPIWWSMDQFFANAWAWAAFTFVVWAAVRRWPLARERWTSSVLAHAAIAAAIAALLMAGRWAAGFGAPGAPLVDPSRAAWLGWDLLTYAMIAAFTQATVWGARHREHELRAARAERELAGARLDLLKWHLRPRFLLDTLDDVADVAARDVDRADDITTRLGDLLRHVLQHVDGEGATVAHEAATVEAWLDIRRLRAPGRLVARVDVDPAVADAIVPGMSLLPMVEPLLPDDLAAPAIGHAPLEVRVAARREVGTVVVVASVSRTQAAPDAALLPLRARLAATLGARHRLDARAGADGGVHVTLELPFVPSPASPTSRIAEGAPSRRVLVERHA